MRALIVEHGGSRAALAAARALRSTGWEVGLAAPSRQPPAAYSRAVARWHHVPPSTDRGPFVCSVAAAIEEAGYEIVLGADDADMIALSEGRDALDAIVGHPAPAVIRRALDKLRLTAAASESGVAVPRTWSQTDDWPEANDRPVVVKAREHAAAGSELSRIEVARATTRSEAESRAAWIRERGGEPFFQELVDGRLEAFVGVTDASYRLVVSSHQVATGTYPPALGRSTRARVVAVDPAMEEVLERLLARLEWSGIFELQFVRAEGEPPKLLDLNGRIYGSLELTVAAGLNLPDVWARIATGRPPPERPVTRVGARYQWLEGDIRRALVERRRGLVRDVAGSLAYGIGAHHSMMKASDPVPAIAMVGMLARRAVRRGLRRR